MRRVLIVLSVLAVALVAWSLTNTFIHTIQSQSEAVKDYYGWIP